MDNNNKDPIFTHKSRNILLSLIINIFMIKSLLFINKKDQRFCFSLRNYHLLYSRAKNARCKKPTFVIVI